MIAVSNTQKSHSGVFVAVVALTTNAWTFGLIDLLNNYVQYVKVTNRVLYFKR